MQIAKDEPASLEHVGSDEFRTVRALKTITAVETNPARAERIVFISSFDNEFRALHVDRFATGILNFTLDDVFSTQPRGLLRHAAWETSCVKIVKSQQ